MHKYEIVIWWSEEDQLFISSAPELGSGCSAHGKSPEEALAEMNSLIAFWLDVLREEGRPIPQPKSQLASVQSGKTRRLVLKTPRVSAKASVTPRITTRKPHAPTPHAV